MRDWAGLPKDILEDISERLTFGVDHVCFRSVCTSWRSSVPGKPQLPLLLLSRDPDSETCSFYSLTDGRIHELRLPVQAIGKRICGSSHGWLVLVDDRSRSVMLFNPITRASIQLPPITIAWSLFSKAAVDMALHGMYKAVLSDNPALSPTDCAVAALLGVHSPSSKLALCRPGDASWIILEESEDFYDVTVFGGKLYALDHYWRLFIYDVRNPTSSWVFQFADWPCRISQGYLVELSGQLLAVMRFHPAGLCVSCCAEFVVTKLDLRETLWPMVVNMESLGDRMLFLGINQSLSRSGSSFPGCKSDCVYYSNFPLLHFGADFEIDSRQDFGVYCLKDRRMEALGHCTASSLPEWESSIWFTPSLL